ncbi:MAG: tetratricopeptide repeat protein [Elsteraceae bacterium]
MTDVFREVDEEVRRDQLTAFLRRYGVALLALAVLIVAGVGAWVWWRQHQTAQRAQHGVELSKALTLAQAGDAKASAAAAAELASKASDDGYGLLARFLEAAALSETGDRDGALKKLDAIAADRSADQMFRDLAVLRGAYLRVDQEPAAAFAQRVAPLLVEGGVWRFSALELSALSSIRAGDKAAATATLKKITDDAAAPSGLRARAAELLSSLGG